MKIWFMNIAHHKQISREKQLIADLDKKIIDIQRENFKYVNKNSIIDKENLYMSKQKTEKIFSLLEKYHTELFKNLSDPNTFQKDLKECFMEIPNGILNAGFFLNLIQKRC